MPKPLDMRTSQNIDTLESRWVGNVVCFTAKGNPRHSTTVRIEVPLFALETYHDCICN